MRAAIAALLIAATAVSASAKDEPADLSAYPELSVDRALPLIAAALRDTLFDAGSTTNFKICTPPVKIKWKDGRPVRWTFLLSLNSKNQYGGYAGNQAVSAIFYANEPVKTFSLGMPLLPSTCPTSIRVPDAQMQRLIQGD